MISSFISAQHTRKVSFRNVFVCTLWYRISIIFLETFCDYSSTAGLQIWQEYWFIHNSRFPLIRTFQFSKDLSQYTKFNTSLLLVQINWLCSLVLSSELRNKHSKPDNTFRKNFFSKTMIWAYMGHNAYVAWSRAFPPVKIHLEIKFWVKLPNFVKKVQKIAKFRKKSFYLELLWKTFCWRNDCDQHRRLHENF